MTPYLFFRSLIVIQEIEMRKRINLSEMCAKTVLPVLLYKKKCVDKSNLTSFPIDYNKHSCIFRNSQSPAPYLYNKL